MLVPEYETSLQEVADTIEYAYRRGKTHCIVVVAEGAHPNATELSEQINNMEIGFHTRVTILGHIQRGGKPTASDRMLASRLGSRAVEVLLEGQRGVMVGLDGREIVTVPLETVIANKKPLPNEFIKMARVLAR